MTLTSVTVVITMLILIVVFVQSIESKKWYKGPFNRERINEDFCVDNPCLNDGTCIVEESGFNCLCRSEYTGTLCETEKCPQSRTLKCINGVLTTDDSQSCIEGYIPIVYNTTVCFNQIIQESLCVPADLSDAAVRYFGSSLYLFAVSTKKIFVEAKKSCSLVCGTLVEINSKEEDNFLLSTAAGLGMGLTWIGLQYIGTDFVWLSGNTTNLYSNWGSGFPYKEEEGRCGELDLRPGSTNWKEYYCTEKLEFLCEI